MYSNDEKDAFDKAFLELHNSIETDEAARVLTDAVISGRLSIYLMAEKALKANMSLKEFVVAMQLVLSEELKTGQIDESSFKILESFNYPDDRLPGI